MREAPPGQCKYCKCTEENPCGLPCGDTCGWITRQQNVCTAPSCARQYFASLKASRPRKLSSSEINGLICGKSRKKKWKAA